MNVEGVFKIAREAVKGRRPNKAHLFHFQKRLRYVGRDVQQLLANTNIFFVLGTGRSGTQWLSSLLNTAHDTLVLHEPCFYDDIAVMERSKNSKSCAYEYVRNFRRYFIYEDICRSGVGTYGEVTGTLRYHVQALKDVLPEARILLMARDIRDIIRSMWKRTAHYNEGSTGAYNLKPRLDEPYYDRWMQMSRFEKFCWSCMHSYNHMLNHIPDEEVFHFEDILDDYDHFLTKVLSPLGLDISKERWREAVNFKSPNATKDYNFPHWRDWSVGDKEAFTKICGPTMERLGYEMDGMK